MRVVADIETNGLNPDKIHCLVLKGIDDGRIHVFRDRSSFEAFDPVTYWIGHNFLCFDAPILRRLWGLTIPETSICDTLVCSRLFDATRDGHSIEAWGPELGRQKVGADITDWSVWTQNMEDRCVSDVEINYLLFKKFEKFITSPLWRPSLETEHFIQARCLDLHENGFAFDYEKATKLKSTIETEVTELDAGMRSGFAKKVRFIREYTPRVTQYGTIAKNSVPRSEADLTGYNGGPFSTIRYEEFSATSHKQRIERLWEAGWSPVNKSKSHREADKEIGKLRRKRKKTQADRLRISELEGKLEGYKFSGWMTTDEENLDTLPVDAPPEFQKLARFVKLTNRVSTLESWLKVYNKDTNRIHGSFSSIGAWTHRMSHDKPNMGNIPKYDARQPEKTPYSDKMRELWCSAADCYLVGVDAESIQLRIFGHYLNDETFIKALVSGDKKDETDPHSLNRKALGGVCKSRDDAKTFIYAWLLGAGIVKVSQILGCSVDEARIANDAFIEFYPGLAYLKKHVIPIDAARGYFQGFDGRYVRIWGEDEASRQHFTLAGYLQNGESVIMKRGVQIWYPRLVKERIPFKFVNFVHDEFQIEVPRDMEIAQYVATVVADSIRQVGIDLNLNCPFAGSILNSHGKLAVGDNWMVTH